MERGMTADQVLGAVWRRKKLVAAIIVCVLAVGAAILVGLPSVYRATVVVRVEPQRPDPTLVQRTISEDIENRLTTIREELLGRPVLQKVIESENLYPAVVAERGMDAAVERMRKDVEVKVDGTSAFEISYMAPDAKRAAEVANEIPKVYAAQTLALRQQEAARTTSMFNDEVEKLEASVAEWQKKIAAFKVAHLGELPEQLEANMRGLERVAQLIETKSEALRVVDARRSALMLAHDPADTEAGRLDAAEDDLQRQLTAAKARFTPDHPEVQRLTAAVAAMHQQRVAAESKLTAERHERGLAIRQEKALRKNLEDLQSRAEAFQKRLDQTPKWAQQLGVLESQYQIVKTKYDSVVSRKVEAEIAEEMEARNAKTLFNVVSPAEVPVGPAKPDRLTGGILVLLLALAAGLLTAVVLEMRDDSLRDLHEVRGRLPFPVLAVVPRIEGKADRRVLVASGQNQISPP